MWTIVQQFEKQYVELHQTEIKSKVQTEEHSLCTWVHELRERSVWIGRIQQFVLVSLYHLLPVCQSKHLFFIPSASNNCRFCPLCEI